MTVCMSVSSIVNQIAVVGLPTGEEVGEVSGSEMAEDLFVGQLFLFHPLYSTGIPCPLGLWSPNST